MAETATRTVCLWNPEVAPAGVALRRPREAARREPGRPCREPRAETLRGALVRESRRSGGSRRRAPPQLPDDPDRRLPDRVASLRIVRTRTPRHRPGRETTPRPPRPRRRQPPPLREDGRLATGRPARPAGTRRPRSPPREDPTLRRCSRPAPAPPWTCTAGGPATGRPRSAPPDSPTAGHTR